MPDRERRGAFGRPDTRPVPLLHRGWAFAIVRRSRVLSAALKLLYGRMLELDRGSAGVYASLEHLAADVGFAPDHVRKLRKELLDIGLLHVHRVRTATGPREFWYCTLPVALDEPPRESEAAQWIADWSGLLDAQLSDGVANSAAETAQNRQAKRPNSPSPHDSRSSSDSNSPVLVSQTESVSRVFEIQSENYQIESENLGSKAGESGTYTQGGIPREAAPPSETPEQKRERFRLQIAAAQRETALRRPA